MNNESDTGAPDNSHAAPDKKKPLVSIPFLVIAIGLGAAGYFCGPWVMTQLFFWQGKNGGNKPSGNVAAAEVDESEGEGGYGGEGGGGRGGQGGGGRGGRGDPEAFWARIDADGNGKVEGEEISERMAERASEIDTDGDGAISKEEFLAGMASRGGGRGERGAGGGRGERGGGGGRGGSERPSSDEGASPSEEAPDDSAPGETSPVEEQSDSEQGF